jgi:DNA-binding transcriptional MocR family regulator
MNTFARFNDDAWYNYSASPMILSVSDILAGIAEWTEPTAGMFLWIKLKVR